MWKHLVLTKVKEKQAGPQKLELIAIIAASATKNELLKLSHF